MPSAEKSGAFFSCIFIVCGAQCGIKKSWRVEKRDVAMVCCEMMKICTKKIHHCHDYVIESLKTLIYKAFGVIFNYCICITCDSIPRFCDLKCGAKCGAKAWCRMRLHGGYKKERLIANRPCVYYSDRGKLYSARPWSLYTADTSTFNSLAISCHFMPLK